MKKHQEMSKANCEVSNVCIQEKHYIFSDLSQVEVAIHGNKTRQIGTTEKAGPFLSMNVPTWHRLLRNSKFLGFACRMSQHLEGQAVFFSTAHNRCTCGKGLFHQSFFSGLGSVGFSW